MILHPTNLVQVTTSVFIGDDIPEWAHSTMHLQDVLGMWYGFTYSPSSKVAPQTNAPLSSFALKICEGVSTLPSESSLCATLIAFLEKLTMAQPPDPALYDLLNDSLLNEYLRSLFIIQRHQNNQNILLNNLSGCDRSCFHYIPR